MMLMRSVDPSVRISSLIQFISLGDLLFVFVSILIITTIIVKCFLAFIKSTSLRFLQILALAVSFLHVPLLSQVLAIFLSRLLRIHRLFLIVYCLHISLSFEIFILHTFKLSSSSHLGRANVLKVLRLHEVVVVGSLYTINVSNLLILYLSVNVSTYDIIKI